MSNSFPLLNCDIIIIGQQPWDTEIGSNCKNIALEWSKTNRVLYINSPLDRITLFRHQSDPKIKKRLQVIKGKESGLVKIQDNLWNFYPDCMVESINWLGSHRVFNFLNKLNNKRLAKSVQQALLALNMNNYILFNDNEMFKGFYLQDLLKPLLGIYYSRDFMLGVDYWRKHGEALEPALIAKSQLCFANSEYLAEYCRQYNKQSYNVGQGCDIEVFKNYVPVELPDLKVYKGPIIGYVGALSHSRLDIELLVYIAESLPDHLLVLVGPEDDEFVASKLHQLSNVLFSGQKPVEDLPHYINAFDICINPQLVNPITIGNYPRKIDEYLAMGKPVIATRTKTMEFFEDFVCLANTKEEYVPLILTALKDDSEEMHTARKEFAYTHTWENSVGQMKTYIADLL